jgi:hypothetical protein
MKEYQYKNRFVKFILPLIFILTASFAYSDELWKVPVDDFSKGQMSYDLPHKIPSTAGPLVQNAVISRKGRISKRKGVTLFAQDMSDTAWTGIGRFTPTSVNDYLMIASGPEILRSTSSASWVTVTTALSSGHNTEFVQCNKELAILNGVDYPGWYNGVTFTAGVSGSASPPVAKYGAWFKNYLFLAHGETEKDWVWFSDNLTPKVFTPANLYVFKVNTGDGQAIMAIKPFKLDELCIYKERSVWVLNCAGATPMTDWTLQPVLEDVGLIAPRSVATVGNDQWFLSSVPVGVRSLVRTAYDKIQTSLVSTPIQDIFDGTGDTVVNMTHINKAAGIFFDNKYLLAVPENTSTVNNLVLVCDAITQGWYQITNWYVADWHIFDDKLYYIDSLDGRCFRAFYGNNDQASGPRVTYTDASGPTTEGVSFHYESKAFDFDSPELWKIPDALEVVCSSSGNYSLDVYIQLDSGGWESIGAMSLAGESTNLPQDLPFDLSSEKLARHTFDLQQYGEFLQMQVGFHQDASDTAVEIREYRPFAKKRKWRRNP